MVDVDAVNPDNIPIEYLTGYGADELTAER
jgi:hypothetical protein